MVLAVSTPLTFHEGGTTTGIQADVGDRVAFGGNLISNTGTEPVTDIRARLVPADPADGGVPDDQPGASIVEVKVIEVEKENIGFLGAGPWPDEETESHARGIEGYALPPDGKDVSVLFVLDVRRDGRWKWARTEVSYVYRGEEYTTTTDNALVICAPRSFECEM
jgi:hypothetical protein